jgi:hypothetical protein
MAINDTTATVERVENDIIWRQTRSLFLAAMLLFLVNIAIGFDNALSTGAIPRWQLLTHLHAGALGWITLSVIGLAIWIFTGERDVGDGYVRSVRLLGWLSVLAFAAYIASFALAFSRGGDSLLLLPVFGTGAMLMIWAAALYVLMQLRHQPVVTTVHVLLTGGLLVAALGATMGVLTGLHYATGAGINAVEVHPPIMLFYLFLVASAVVEWIALRDRTGGWTRSGIAQGGALVVGAIIPPVAFLGGLEMLAPLMLVMLFLFLLLFVVRVGWRALYSNPFEYGVDAWVFFGAFWLVVIVVLFPAEIVLQPKPPEWLLPVLAHIGFVGMATNLLFGVITARTENARALHPWAEPAAMWLLNLGMVIFFALKILADIRLGALVMGLGALLGVASMLYRLVKSPAGTRTPGAGGEGVPE